MIQRNGAPMTTDMCDCGDPSKRRISKRMSSFCQRRRRRAVATAAADKDWGTTAAGAVGDVRT
jgi:hypothetical protein